MINKQSSCEDIYETGLMPVQQALENIFAAAGEITGHQRVPIEQARGRILSNNIISPLNVPALTNSAVDGYALFSGDLPVKDQTATLQIAGAAFAGKPYTGSTPAGHCIRIMTGAAMPNRCDTVIMQEHCERQNNSILIDAALRPGQNIRQSGEDIQQGQTILRQGRLLTPPDIGLLASLGITEIDVKRKLCIALASTGDEVYDIGSNHVHGGIYDSNRYSLLSALQRPDIDIINMGILEDAPAALLHEFTTTAGYADLIISTGGVSVGDADHTKTALAQSGQIDFWKIAIKPGRPLAFGRVADSVFFGLPGNPVAVMVTFYLFVLPAIEKMLGIKDKPLVPQLKARAMQDIRKKPGRMEVPRGIIEQSAEGEWQVKITGKQGSGILRSMSQANAFILLPHNSSTIHKGDWVSVQPFSGLF